MMQVISCNTNQCDAVIVCRLITSPDVFTFEMEITQWRDEFGNFVDDMLHTLRIKLKYLTRYVIYSQKLKYIMTRYKV